MKKSVDILGLPVISVMDGKELGKVKDLVINPAGGYISALVIDDGKWYLGAKLLPYAGIMGIGEYAITVQNTDSVVTVASRPDFESLLEADVKVIGTKILTNTGRILGTVNEVVLDETGKITACEVEETDGDFNHIPGQQVVTYAKGVTIVNDAEQPVAATAVKPVTPQAVQTPAPAVDAAANPDDSGKRFDEKHRKYLLGKKAGRRIETDNGVLIVDQGGEITEEVLQKAKLAGKFVELSMSIQ